MSEDCKLSKSWQFEVNFNDMETYLQVVLPLNGWVFGHRIVTWT